MIIILQKWKYYCSLFCHYNKFKDIYASLDFILRTTFQKVDLHLTMVTWHSGYQIGQNILGRNIFKSLASIISQKTFILGVVFMPILKRTDLVLILCSYLGKKLFSWDWLKCNLNIVTAMNSNMYGMIILNLMTHKLGC